MTLKDCHANLGKLLVELAEFKKPWMKQEVVVGCTKYGGGPEPGKRTGTSKQTI